MHLMTHPSKVGTMLLKTENGSRGEECDPWKTFITYTTPGTERADVKQRFEVLYKLDRSRAFRYGMMLGNLRHGGGGKADMKSFVACMEVIWELNPKHVTANIKCIMQV